MTDELIAYARNVYSQNGEDGILAEIGRRLDIRSGWFVEFGAWDGRRFSNACSLLENAGWRGVFIECDSSRFKALERTARAFGDRLRILNARVDSEGESTLDKLLAGTGTPQNFDLLSIDIDGNDWHVWQSIEHYRPKIVVIEGNTSILPGVWQVHGEDRGQGSSFSALLKLGLDKGYRLVCHTGNLIFVEDELVHGLALNPLHLESPELLFNYAKHASLLASRTVRARLARLMFRCRESLARAKRKVLARGKRRENDWRHADEN